jgi:hypothetical protein
MLGFTSGWAALSLYMLQGTRVKGLKVVQPRRQRSGHVEPLPTIHLQGQTVLCPTGAAMTCGRGENCT